MSEFRIPAAAPAAGGGGARRLPGLKREISHILDQGQEQQRHMEAAALAERIKQEAILDSKLKKRAMLKGEASAYAMAAFAENDENIHNMKSADDLEQRRQQHKLEEMQKKREEKRSQGNPNVRNFHGMDLDHDGLLSREDLRSCSDAMGLHLSAVELAFMLKVGGSGAGIRLANFKTASQAVGAYRGRQEAVFQAASDRQQQLDRDAHRLQLSTPIPCPVEAYAANPKAKISHPELKLVKAWRKAEKQRVEDWENYQAREEEQRLLRLEEEAAAQRERERLAELAVVGL